MPKPTEVKKIVVHCSAGFGDKASILAYWKNILKWRSVGYHRLIGLHGEIHELAKFEDYTNGVKGHNSTTLHVCYIGGVEKDKLGKFHAKDTRTPEQKKSIIFVIQEMQQYLSKAGVDISKIQIVGHRDFSPDQNHDGVIASWERIKECPSFDAITEYKGLIPKL